MNFKLLKKYFLKFRILFKTFMGYKYFEFVKGHDYIQKFEIKKMKELVGKYRQDIENDYEVSFAKIIGNGKCVSYASCRMGFFSILETLSIKKGDEVILLGSSCAVMSNAVIKTGATPVYSDVDMKNFGSSLDSIKKKISIRTKVIVAQHSFGIPCEIGPISEFAKSKDIFLIEDCALCLDSSIDGIKVGNFGDAAIFSTDHSKPLNTLIGGMVFTRDLTLYYKLKEKHKYIANFSYGKQRSLMKQFIYEINFSKSSKYFFRFILNKIKIFNRLFHNDIDPFLTDDNKTYSENNYPYPAKIPTFLAFLGLIELKNWNKKKQLRIFNMKKYIQICEKFNINIPNIYYSKRLKIVPLRFVWFQKDIKRIKSKLESIIDINSFWFSKPIIEAEEPLFEFGYNEGDCPNSEFIGPLMINLPSNLNKEENSYLIDKLNKIL